MKRRVTVVDYGRGNLCSITRALTHVGAEVLTSSDPQEIARAERLVLPGVGAFGDGMEGLHSRGLVGPLGDFSASQRPLLGICLGMQLLMTESSEFGHHAGLNLIPGKVTRFPDPPPDGPRYKIPHVGWNRLTPASPRPGWENTLFEGLPWESDVYFVHSYFVAPTNPRHRIAETQYAGQTFCSALAVSNITGCQFHPEKSAETGLSILQSWLKMDGNRGAL